MDVTLPQANHQPSKYRGSRHLAAAAALIGAATSGAAFGAASYTYQSLSPVGVNSIGLGINSSGAVVGQLADTSTAAYSTGGGNLQSLGGNSSIAYGVSDNGIAVGSYEPTGGTLPFSIDTKSGSPSYTTLPGVPAGGQGTAYAVTGSVAVGVIQGSGAPTLATEWTGIGSSPTATTLDTRTFAAGTTVGSTAYGVNQLSRGGSSIGVVGQINTSAGNVEGFYYGSLAESPTSPALYALGLGSGGTTVVGTNELNQANAINTSGEIVGATDFGSGEHAFSYDGYFTSGASGTAPEQSLNGTYTDLGTLSAFSGATSEALGINMEGLIVGDSTVGDPADGITHAFVDVPGEGMEDLNDLASASIPGDVYLSSATGINSAGDISGTAVDPTSGNEYAFELTPSEVPEPASMAGMLVVAGLSFRRRRRV